jgi:hypothetical protein
MIWKPGDYHMYSTLFSDYFWIGLILSTPFYFYIIYRYLLARRNRPRVNKNEILFEENFASGSSMKNFLTSVGGARNCLRLVATEDLLWITSWFPFSLLTTVCDLEHIVPLNRVTKVENIGDEIHLDYSDENGLTRSLKVISQNKAHLLQLLSKKLQQNR